MWKIGYASEFFILIYFMLGFFIFICWITSPTALWFWKMKKKKKYYKSQKMWTVCDKFFSKCCLQKAVIILKYLNWTKGTLFDFVD